MSFIRPVPPEDLYNGVVLEVGTVVDADYKDGWRSGGVVLKRLEAEAEDEKTKFLVYFDSPPGHFFQFQSKQLRAHFDWDGSKWFRPETKELDKSTFSSGTMVELSSIIDKDEEVWSPAMIIKKIENKFIVKHLSCNNNNETRPNTVVDSRRVRPKPPTFPVGEEYDLLDCVEAFRSSVWRKGLVRGILSGKQYMVSLEATKEESLFQHSDIRLLQEWEEDGVWRHKPTRKIIRATVVKKKPMTPITTPVRVTKLTKNPEENGANRETAEVTSIAISPVTPSLVVTATTPEKTTEPMENPNGLGNDSTRKTISEEEHNEDTSRKRKRQQEKEHNNSETDETCDIGSKINDTSKRIRNDDDQPLSAMIGTELSSNVASNASASASDVEVTPQGKEITVLPFKKKSPYWKKCESTKDFRSSPQTPHFSPLSETEEDMREMSAVGLMVTFYGLIDEVKELKLDDDSSSTERLNSLSESFANLKKHGFVISKALSRIKKFSSLKDVKMKKDGERKCVEKMIEEGEHETRDFEEEILEIEKRVAVVKEKKEATEKKTSEMKLNVEKIDKEIEQVEAKFQETVAAPLS